jgi:hypothetical protein
MEIQSQVIKKTIKKLNPISLHTLEYTLVNISNIPKESLVSVKETLAFQSLVESYKNTRKRDSPKISVQKISKNQYGEYPFETDPQEAQISGFQFYRENWKIVGAEIHSENIDLVKKAFPMLEMLLIDDPRTLASNHSLTLGQ